MRSYSSLASALGTPKHIQERFGESGGVFPCCPIPQCRHCKPLLRLVWFHGKAKDCKHLALFGKSCWAGGWPYQCLVTPMCAHRLPSFTCLLLFLPAVVWCLGFSFPVEPNNSFFFGSPRALLFWRKVCRAVLLLTWQPILLIDFLLASSVAVSGEVGISFLLQVPFPNFFDHDLEYAGQESASISPQVLLHVDAMSS